MAARETVAPDASIDCPYATFANITGPAKSDSFDIDIPETTDFFFSISKTRARPQVCAACYEMRRYAMSDRIHELLNRNLQDVFGEGDASRRRTAIEELYTDDCVLYVPTGVLLGHEALDKFAGDLRATHPEFAYTPLGEPQALHNAGRLAWGSGPRGETAGLQRFGRDHCSRRQDRRSLCIP
jgi:hypothetical protein